MTKVHRLDGLLLVVRGCQMMRQISDQVVTLVSLVLDLLTQLVVSNIANDEERRGEKKCADPNEEQQNGRVANSSLLMRRINNHLVAIKRNCCDAHSGHEDRHSLQTGNQLAGHQT